MAFSRICIISALTQHSKRGIDKRKNQPNNIWSKNKIYGKYYMNQRLLRTRNEDVK
jgi:hypothetical protein